MKCSIESLLKQATLELRQVAQSLYLKPQMESEILLSFLLQVPRVYLHTHSTQYIESTTAKSYFALINERKSGKPIEYITQSANFYGRAFFVNPDVLIPRPETEMLIDIAHHLINTHHIQSIAEIGIGSGIITTTLALISPTCHFFATDISKAALKVAQKNIATYAPNANITLQHCDILPSPAPSFDLLISNPPYIEDDYPISRALNFEPKTALFGGKDGLDIYRQIFKHLSEVSNVWLLCEIGYNQKQALSTMLANANAQNIVFHKDLSGWDRCVCAYFP